MNDLVNSRHYNERALKRILEPEDSRTRQMAVEEIRVRQRTNLATRAFGKYIQKTVDFRGQIQERIHRTISELDSDGNEHIKEISDYKNAWPLRRLAEEFVADKIAPQLQTFEAITEQLAHVEYQWSRHREQLRKNRYGSSKHQIMLGVPIENPSGRELKLIQSEQDVNALQKENIRLFETVEPCKFQADSFVVRNQIPQPENEGASPRTFEDGQWALRFMKAKVLDSEQKRDHP